MATLLSSPPPYRQTLSKCISAGASDRCCGSGSLWRGEESGRGEDGAPVDCRLYWTNGGGGHRARAQPPQPPQPQPPQPQPPHAQLPHGFHTNPSGGCHVGIECPSVSEKMKAPSGPPGQEGSGQVSDDGSNRMEGPPAITAKKQEAQLPLISCFSNQLAPFLPST